MLQRALSFLKFLKLVDADGTVSLTSVALAVVLVKLAMSPALSITEIGALLLGLLSYQGKKIIGQREVASEVSEQLADLGTKVQAVTGELTGDNGLMSRLTRVESRSAELARVPRR